MSWETTFDTWAAAYLPDVAVVCDEPMSRHTSFRIGGPAKRMAFPRRGEQLVLLAEFFHVSTDYLLGITDDPAWRGQPLE